MNIFNKKLNRNTLVDKLIKYRKENKYIDNYYFVNYINIIEREFSKHKFTSDSDFLINGRREFLVKEFYDVLKNEDNYNQKHCIDEPLYFALGNLQEILSGNNMVNIDEAKSIKINETYNKKNIICLEEKQLIEEMLKEFKNKLTTNKFKYDKEELIICDSQCNLCKHKIDDNYGCSKFGKVPQEVLKNEFKCNEFKSKTASYSWDEE